MSGFEPYLPEDFAEFWKEAYDEALRVPLEVHRSLTNDFDLSGFIVETFEFLGVENRKLKGWIAHSSGARRQPAFLWINPYGRESLLPDEYGTREGFVSLSFNFFGHGPFHQEKYVTARGYMSEGAESPETSVFRRMFQDCVIATKVLQAQVEVDENRIGVMGMSQGGGIAIWLGAWCSMIRAVCADMPFFGAVQSTLGQNVYRYPMKELQDFMAQVPLGEERVMNTVSYFDTMNHASVCTKPSQVSLGLKDPASRPDNVRAIYEALVGPKLLRVYDWGHDWHPDMISNNRQWLEENMRPQLG